MSYPTAVFFNQVAEEGFYPEVNPARRQLGINLAGDMLDTRFNGTDGQALDFAGFMDLFVGLITEVMEANDDLDVVLYPHIFRDYPAISAFLDKMPDKLTRERIRVAPYVQGEAGRVAIFGSYGQCDLVIGNRFHTNVCCIGMGVPTIGLMNYPKIGLLYEELGMPERCVDIRRVNFVGELRDLLNDGLKNGPSITESYESLCRTLSEQLDRFHGDIHQWLVRKFR